jgi:hypothetical protein
MSSYSTAYQVACTPGPEAAVAMTRGPGGAPVLVVYLDPVNMTIQAEPSALATREFVAFCRELAREATRLADLIEPPTADSARHRLRAER